MALITYIATPTGQPVTGSIYFDNAVGSFKIYDGTKWTVMAHSPDDIMDKHLITDELTFGSLTFYTVEPKGYDWDELHNWCQEIFGPPRDGIKIQETLYNKWFTSGGSFHFHEEKHRDWFMIKWSSE